MNKSLVARFLWFMVYMERGGEDRLVEEIK